MRLSNKLYLQSCHFLKLCLYRCICGKCDQMPTEPENVCCREIPQVELFVNDIVIMQSSSVLYSMLLTLSIFKVTRRLLQLQNQPTCMVDYQGLVPVCVLTTECIQHL